MAAPNSTATDVNSIEAITVSLTRTVLGGDVVNTDPAAETSTNVDEVDEIANDLGQTNLGEDNKQSLPAVEDEAVEKSDGEAELDPAGVAPEQAAEEEEEEEGIDALGAACGSLSIKYDDDAEAQREAQLLREQIKREHEEKMRALASAEAKRQADEELDAFTRQFQADIDGAKVKGMKRKARKEKDEEAARQLRAEAEAEEIALAERRAEQERRMRAEAEAAQVKRESDNRARLELSQIYENIVASNIARANAQEAQRQQQIREAELIAQYHEAVRRQLLADEERRQQAELFLQNQLAEQQRLAEQQYLADHYNAYPLGEQVSQGAEEMDVAPEGVILEGAEMQAAEMDWEQVEELTPLPAELLLPLPQPMELAPSEPELSAPAEELLASRALLVVNSLDSEVLEPKASSNRIAEERPAMPAADKVEASSHASTVADNITGPPSAAGPNTADNYQQPATIAVVRPIEADATTPTQSTSAVEEAATAPAEAPAITAPLPPANALHLLPGASTPPPPPAPMPAPIESSQKTIKIVLKRAFLDPALAALRPTIKPWSPLGQLLSQKTPIPRVALPQVLGKRTMEDREGSGRDQKKAKLEGEFRFEVGGKRKREDETFPGKKRILCNRRVLVVPCSRLAATPPIISPTSPAIAPLSPAPLPAPLPPPSAVEPLLARPHSGLAEAINFYNDLPTLRAEIAWMRGQRNNTSLKETRGKKAPANKRTITSTSYWSRYRENLSR